MTVRIRLIAALIAFAPTGASADTKTGVDAYLRGDFATAVDIWRPLAVAGDADAQYNLGQAYKLGRGVTADPGLAESWYRKAAEQGHRQAQNAYGLTLFQNGNRRSALPYLEASAGHGFPQAQYVYATMLFNGDMVEKDWVRAYALMTRASAGGVTAASASLEQLDRFIPAAQRERGLTLARAFEAAGATPDPALPDVPKPALPPVPKAVAGALAAKPVPGGSWRVQLGAFGNVARASALWAVLQKRVSALAPYRSYFVPAGAVVRLQAGPLAGRAEAVRLCAAISADGQPCFTVAP